MKRIFTLSLIFVLLSCSNEDRSKPVEMKKNGELVNEYKAISVNDSLQPYIDSLVNYESIYDEAVGYAGSKSTVYTWFEKLMALADDNELKSLTNHSSPAVRGYSFWALVEREHPSVKKIIIEHKDDSAYVRRMSGCIIYQEKLNDFLLSIVAPNCVDVDCSRLPPEDIAEIKEAMK